MDASAIGFIIILFFYFTVGLGGAVGCIAITRTYLRPRWEQVFYATFLIVIALAYLAFTAYFGADGAWPLETRAVIAFSVLALVGMRVPLALVVAYPLHGIWDVLHELQLHGGYASFDAGASTPTPLAYGALCAAFDFAMAGYFLTRRKVWRDAWQSGAATTPMPQRVH
ncbi:MAG: hypothetical protein K0Q76_1479 [Panacagrimonas sp.]|jgi:hypothetical protein|nr:DUF6010 family protein [Panacagrimonas sp.]MCC2656371.1 hypothetical protein [Panacagrimonas sp.]